MAGVGSSRGFMIQAKELFDAGQFSAAITTLQEGLKQYPHYSGARVLLGEIYWTTGEMNLAQAELEQVIRAVPDNFAAHRRLAMIYRESGDLASAIRSCHVVLQVNPTDQEMRALLEQISPSSVESVAASPREAPQAPLRTLSNDNTAAAAQTGGPESIDTETLAELYLLQGHREKGLAIYRRLAAKNPGHRRYLDRIDELEDTLSNGVGEENLPEPLAALALDGSAERPAQTPAANPEALEARKRRKHKVRRLEGWLQVIRDRRRQ